MTSPAAVPRVIYDLDGSIDDCLALFILLFAEKCGLVKIEALTSAPGSAPQEYVLKNIYRILEAAERTDIPVYKGTKGTFFDPNFSETLDYGKDGFGDVQWTTEPNVCYIKKSPAACAMGELVINNPGQISIIGTAPPVNIVLAAKLYDAFMNDVKVIQLMGGNYRGLGTITPYAEWNFFVETEGAAMLLDLARAAGKPIRMVSIEAVLETNIDLVWRDNLFCSTRNRVINIISQAEDKIYPSVYQKYLPADSYAVATFILPDLVLKYEVYPADVVRGCVTKGQVAINYRNDTKPNAYFIERVDEEKFKELLTCAVKETEKSFKPKFREECYLDF